MPRSRSRRSAGAPVLQRTVADLRALAHPLRLRMMELFAESPKTTKQVAGLLGQPPTRLYHHVAALERSGLLVLKEKRQNRGAVEKWYAGISQQIRTAGSKGKSRAARRAVAATVLEQAKQELLSSGAGRRGREPALLARLVIAVPRAKIAAIRKRLFDTVQSLRSAGPRGGGKAKRECERWAVTVAFAPVAPPKAISSG